MNKPYQPFTCPGARFTRTAIDIALAVTVASSISGCATQAIEQRTVEGAARVTVLTANIAQSAAKRADAVVPVYLREAGPWFSDRTVARDASQALPSAFDKVIVFRTTQAVSLSDFAAELQAATGVPVHVSSVDAGTAASPTTLNFSGSARSALSAVPQKFGATWSFADGVVTLSPSIVRTFFVERLAVDVGGTVGGRRDPWTDLETTLKTIAPSAKLVFNRGTNSLTVVGSPYIMADIERYLAMDAEQSGRVVHLKWQLVNYSAKTTGEAGLALDYIIKRNGGSANFASGAAPSGSSSILKVARDAATAASNGSTGTLNLLNESGTAVVVKEGWVTIKNNDAVALDATSSISYAAKSSLAAISTAGAVGAGTTTSNTVAIVTDPGSVDVGLDIKFSATVHPSEGVDVGYDFSIKVLDVLREVRTTAQFQQFPETSKRSVKGRNRLQNGETYLIASDTSGSTSFDRRGLLPGTAAILGGTESAKSTDTQWLLMLMPVIGRKGL